MAGSRGGQAKYFPPQLHLLMAWSTLFRSPGTWGNYLGYVKTGCLICNAPATVSGSLRSTVLQTSLSQRKVFDHSALKRAKMSIAARRNCICRKPMWLQRLVFCAFIADLSASVCLLPQAACRADRHCNWGSGRTGTVRLLVLVGLGLLIATAIRSTARQGGPVRGSSHADSGGRQAGPEVGQKVSAFAGICALGNVVCTQCQEEPATGQRARTWLLV